MLNGRFHLRYTCLETHLGEEKDWLRDTYFIHRPLSNHSLSYPRSCVQSLWDLALQNFPRFLLGWLLLPLALIYHVTCSRTQLFLLWFINMLPFILFWCGNLMNHLVGDDPHLIFISLWLTPFNFLHYFSTALERKWDKNV